MQDKAIKSTDSRVFLSTKQCRNTQRTKAVDENSAKSLLNNMNTVQFENIVSSGKLRTL